MEGRVARLVTLVGLALALSFATPLACRAQATEPLPEVVDQNLGGVAEFYAKTSGAADLGCSQVCALVDDDYQRPPTAPPSVPTLPADPVKGPWYKTLFDKGKSLVRAPWAFPPALVRYSGVGALAAGNYYVWKVLVYDRARGRYVNDYYIKIPRGAFSLSEVSRWVVTDGTGNWWPTFYDLPDPLPVGIVAIKANSNSTILWQTAPPGVDNHCSQLGPVNTPDWVQEYTWRWNRCSQYSWGGGPVSDITAHGWKVHVDVALNPDLDPPGRPNTPDTFSTDLQPLTREEIEQRLRELLESNDPDYAKLRNWLCALLGGPCRNPKDFYPHTPSCFGTTPAVCIQRFRDAGFTGPVTEKVLPDDRAVMEVGAGLVTDTDPDADIDDVVNHDIVIYRNPDSMPTMAVEDDALAETLKAQNPETVTDTNKRTIARTCRTLMRRAFRPNSDCETLPIFVVGHESPTPAENDWVAIARNPSWAVLNRRDVTGLSRGSWFFDRATPEPGCLQAEKPLPSAECDEYPYFSSLQAYGATLNTATPGIRWVPQRENGDEGRALQQFYSTRGPGPTLQFRGCGITAQNPTDVVPIDASRYIVVPVGHSERVATTGLCNSSSAP